MPNIVRSAKGELVDFELLAIKAQLASQAVPSAVEKRQQAIIQKDTGKTVAISEDAGDMLAVSTQAAAASQKGKQISRK